jgi:hypothetical protein
VGFVVRGTGRGNERRVETTIKVADEDPVAEREVHERDGFCGEEGTATDDANGAPTNPNSFSGSNAEFRCKVVGDGTAGARVLVTDNFTVEEKGFEVELGRWELANGGGKEVLGGGVNHFNL